MKSIKKFLYLSIVLNVILIVLSALLFMKTGGFKAVASMVDKKEPSYNENPYFVERVSLFNELKIPRNSFVFLGDSLTQRTEWSEFFPNTKVINRGVGSDTTTGVLHRLDDIITSEPNKIFLMIGINDIANKIDNKEIIANYTEILKEIKAKSPKTMVYVQSILPVNNSVYGTLINNKDVEKVNNDIKSLSVSMGYTYIDLYHELSQDNQLKKDYTVDGIHLKGNAYKIWVNTISQYIYK